MIVAIIGPTGVGKTKMSVELAKKIDAEIINADSMQVYRGLDIGTAKVREEEKEQIPHHLFDIAEIQDFYTVFDYQRDCRKTIEEIEKRGKNVILVGGTGLYLKAALYDYQFKENTTYHEYANFSNQEILEKIEKYQPTDIHVNNRKRLVRLLNKLENKEPITHEKDHLLYDVIFIGLTTERKNLYKIIDDRVDQMLKNGLLEEVKKYQKYFSSSKALQTGIGYKEFCDYFNHKKSLEEIVLEIKKNSRHYAKRQYTFFHHQMKVQWFDVDFSNFENTVNQVYQYIQKKQV